VEAQIVFEGAKLSEAQQAAVRRFFICYYGVLPPTAKVRAVHQWQGRIFMLLRVLSFFEFFPGTSDPDFYTGDIIIVLDEKGRVGESALQTDPDSQTELWFEPEGVSYWNFLLERRERSTWSTMYNLIRFRSGC